MQPNAYVWYATKHALPTEYSAAQRHGATRPETTEYSHIDYSNYEA